MEIIGIIIFIFIIWTIIASIIEKLHQKIRDRVAHELLDNSFNFEKEKQEVLTINRSLSFVKTENKCPSCGGILIARHGMYGPFWGCSNYPNCKFTKQRGEQATPTTSWTDSVTDEE